MPQYCSVCGEELAPEEEEEGMCASCKLAASSEANSDEIEPDAR